MFERFTDDARRTVFAARSLALARGDDRTGALHLLSALTTGDSVGARVLAGHGVDSAAVARLLGPATGTAPGTDADAEALAAIGIDLDEIRRKLEESFGAGALDQQSSGRAPGLRGYTALTDQAKLTLSLALKEAVALHHHYLGTEHLLLGLLRAAEPGPPRRRGGPGLRQALTVLGLSYGPVREQVLALLPAA